MPDDPVMRQAVEAAEAHADAAREVVDFLRRLTPAPGPAATAEYANLLAREQSTADARARALRAAGLSVPSLDADR